MSAHERLAKIRARCVELLEIASCAGPAEAGWKATIAAIDDLTCVQPFVCFSPGEQALADAILTAWEGIELP